MTHCVPRHIAADCATGRLFDACFQPRLFMLSVSSWQLALIENADARFARPLACVVRLTTVRFGAAVCFATTCVTAFRMVGGAHLICNTGSIGFIYACDSSQTVQVTGEKLGKAIRNAEMEKVPVVCVVGPRDIEAGVVSVRTYWDGELGQLEHEDVIGRLCDVNKHRQAF